MESEKVLEDRNRKLKRGNPHWRKKDMPQQNIGKLVKPIKEDGMSNQEKMFCGISLTVIPDSEHEWMMSTADVAAGFGCNEEAIRQHKSRNDDELRPNKHWITSVTNSHAGAPPVKMTFWTKRGVVRLGFLINFPRAKIFRDWAEDLVLK